jgi:heme-degrading monooxygenase HmoA
MPYLRMTIGTWNIDVFSSQAADVFRRIEDDGLDVFRAQPGFIRYRLMRADSATTIAVAEWESEELGTRGAQAFREWLTTSGIAQLLTLETYAGDVVVSSPEARA